MRTRRNLWFFVTRVLALFAIAVIVGPCTCHAADARRPNILWLIAEDMGTEQACYGEKHVKTPNIDRLAAQGVRYTNFFLTAPVCSASRSAFMTGMYQTSIGAQNHRSHRDDGFQLPAGVRVLTEWFHDGGYHTANLRRLPTKWGFGGVGKTDWNFTPPEHTFDCDTWRDLPAYQPFFAQINFEETHRKFHAPKHVDPAEVEFPPYYPDHPVTRKDWAAYLDSMEEVDRKVGVLLRDLEAMKLADSTIVVLFADNGEAHVRGKQFCYDSGLHSPLIIRWPKDFPSPEHIKAGSVDDQLIAAIDLGPTMMSLVGIPRPEKMEGRIFLGPKADPPRQYVFGARDRCDETVFRFRTVRDSRYRYIRNFTPDRPFLQANGYKESHYPVWNLLKKLNAEGKLTPTQAALCAPTMPSEELFDLETDPFEIHNLANDPKYSAIKQRLSGALEKWIADTHDTGAVMEPKEVVARYGLTKGGREPGIKYLMDEAPNRLKPAAKK